ncbi:MAG: DUF6055 domain-containing protein [Deltaproteobacteria bacterium]|nr:DUF6055 domain-containing protein [Deltaproteobacteria bacterium]
MAHEFYHVLQFTIALGGCWQYMFSDGDGSSWAVEATATWAEDEVYDDVNAYRYFVDEHMARTEETLNSTDGALAYARSIFFKFISENWGGRQALYDIWNTCNGNLFNSINVHLLGEGSSMKEAFPDFVRRVLQRDFEEGNLYDDVSLHGNYASYPVNQEITGSRTPQSYGANYLKFQPASSERLNFRFEADDQYQGRSIAWVVSLILERSNGSYEIESILGGAKAESEGEISIDGVGSEWSKITMMVVPMVDIVTENIGGITYTVQATEGDDPFVGDDDDDDDDDAGGEQSCDDLVSDIYFGCDFAIEDSGGDLSGDEAYAMCTDDNGPWDCLYECADVVGSCDEFDACAAEMCKVTLSSTAGGGDDDDDDDDGGAVRLLTIEK